MPVQLLCFGGPTCRRRQSRPGADDDLGPGNIHYFCSGLRRCDLPAWFTKPLVRSKASLQPVISTSEAVPLDCGFACLRQLRELGCLATRQNDNLGVVGASSRGFVLAEPLTSGLQSAGLCCATSRIYLRLTHISISSLLDHVGYGSYASFCILAKIYPPGRTLNPIRLRCGPQGLTPAHTATHALRGGVCRASTNPKQKTLS